MIPLWLQDEARRVLGQMKPGVAKTIATEIDLSAQSRLELARSALSVLAKQPAVRSVLDRIREDMEVLRQAERDRREGRR